jgi:hypothetical protein
LAHRRRSHETVECFRRKFAKSIVAALDAHDHGALRVIVADALDDGAAVDIAALECREPLSRTSTASVPTGAVNRSRIKLVAARIMMVCEYRHGISCRLTPIRSEPGSGQI